MTSEDSIRELPFDIRRHEAADLPFVFDSWIKSYWDGINRAPWPTTIAGDRTKGVLQTHLNRDHFFTRGQRELIARCMLTAAVHVAHLRDQPDMLMGFACSAPGLLHYVYVKSPYRRLGVARALVEEGQLGHSGEIVCTHLTSQLARVLGPTPWRFVPNWENEK